MHLQPNSHSAPAAERFTGSEMEMICFTLTTYLSTLYQVPMTYNCNPRLIPEAQVSMFFVTSPTLRNITPAIL